MIVDKARELGMAISQSDEFVTMTNAKAELDADTALCEKLKQFNSMQDKMIELLSDDVELNQDEVQGLSREIDVLQAELLENGIFSAYLAAQGKFQRLMTQVNREIAECLGMQHQDECEEEGCSGSCSSCGMSCSMH